MINKKQYEGVQLMRAVACVLVVLSHVPQGTLVPHSDVWTTYYIIRSFVRIGVPIFLMISGYLLLDKSDDIFLFYTKRAKRIIPPFIFYLLVYYLLVTLQNKASFSVGSFITYVHEGGPIHMWYIFSLIGVYLFMPFLRRIFQSTTDREKLTYCVLWFMFCSIIPFCKILFGYNFDVISLFALNTFAWQLGYVFVGACLKNITIKHPGLFGLCSILCCAAIATISISWSFFSGIEHVEFIHRQSPFYYIAAITTFMALKDCKYSHISYFKKIIVELSTHSFGIYMVHIIVLACLKVLYISPQYAFPWLMNFFSAALAVAISCMFVKYAKKIPYVKSIVG